MVFDGFVGSGGATRTGFWRVAGWTMVAGDGRDGARGLLFHFENE